MADFLLIQNCRLLKFQFSVDFNGNFNSNISEIALFSDHNRLV